MQRSRDNVVLVLSVWKLYVHVYVAVAKSLQFGAMFTNEETHSLMEKGVLYDYIIICQYFSIHTLFRMITFTPLYFSACSACPLTLLDSARFKIKKHYKTSVYRTNLTLYLLFDDK